MSEQEAFSEADLKAAIPRVRAFVGRRVADHAAADDITGKVLERALRYRHSFDGERELGGWLTGIARNQIANHFQAQGNDLEDATADIDLGRDPLAESAFERPVTRESYEEMIAWLGAHPNVSETGLRVGVMALVGRNVTETAFELGISRETVRRQRDRLKPVLLSHPEIRNQLGLGCGISTVEIGSQGGT